MNRCVKGEGNIKSTLEYNSLKIVRNVGWGTRIRTLDNGARTRRIATILSPN